MSAKIKTLFLSLLFTLSLVSFCYINFCPTTQIGEISMAEVLPEEAAELQSVLPEFELIERVLNAVKPIFK